MSYLGLAIMAGVTVNFMASPYKRVLYISNRTDGDEILHAI